MIIATIYQTFRKQGFRERDLELALVGPNSGSTTVAAMEPWASYVNSMCFRFLICKMGILIELTSQSYNRD